MKLFLKLVIIAAYLGYSLAYAQIETPKELASPKVEQAQEASDLLIFNVCRPGALTKMFANLDFYVNGKSIGEIKNKTVNSFKLHLADKFKLGQESSILMARYYDDFAIVGTVSEPGEVFMTLRVKSNLGDALLQTFGGALAVGAVKSFEKGNSKNWDIEVVSKEKFTTDCSFK